MVQKSRKVAIISGVRRIGFYIAQYLISQGYKLAVLYKNSKSRAEELKAYAKMVGTEVLPFEVDLSDYGTYAGIPGKVFEHFGRLDLLLNIASPFGKASVFKFLSDEFGDDIGVASGIVGLAGGMGGFLLPIMFGALIDLTGVNSVIFMLLYGATAVSLIWMHFTFAKNLIQIIQVVLTCF